MDEQTGAGRPGEDNEAQTPAATGAQVACETGAGSPPRTVNDTIFFQAREIMQQITTSRGELDPGLLHQLAGILEEEEQRYQQQVGFSYSNTRSSYSIGRLVTAMRANDDFYELVSSRLLLEPAHSTAVRAAAARLLLACVSCWMFRSDLDEEVFVRLKAWVAEEPTPVGAQSSPQARREQLEREMLRTYATGLLGVALQGDDLVDEVVRAGLVTQLIRFLRKRTLGESTASPGGSGRAGRASASGTVREDQSGPLEASRGRKLSLGESLPSDAVNSRLGAGTGGGLEQGGSISGAGAVAEVPDRMGGMAGDGIASIRDKAKLEDESGVELGGARRDGLEDDPGWPSDAENGEAPVTARWLSGRTGNMGLGLLERLRARRISQDRRPGGVREARHGVSSSPVPAEQPANQVETPGRVLPQPEGLQTPHNVDENGSSGSKGSELVNGHVEAGEGIGLGAGNVDSVDSEPTPTGLGSETTVLQQEAKDTGSEVTQRGARAWVDEQMTFEIEVVGKVDIGRVIGAAMKAAEAEARCADAPAMVVEAAAEAAADSVRAAAIEAVGVGKSEEDILAAAWQAADAVANAAQVVIANKDKRHVEESHEKGAQGAGPKKPIETKEETNGLLWGLAEDRIVALKELYTVQCLAQLGEYLEVLGPVLQERGVEVCLALLRRRDIALLADVLKLVCALAAHRKFAAMFVDSGGVQLILEVPAVPHTWSGLSVCLFALASLQGVMDRVCALPPPTVRSMVALALQLLGCSHDPARKHAALFFGSSFVFPTIVEEFDAQSGLEQLLDVLRAAARLRSGGGSAATAGGMGLAGAWNREAPLLQRQNAINERMAGEVLTSAGRQVAHHACVALRQYMRTHLILLLDTLKPGKGAARNDRRGPTHGGGTRPVDNSTEVVEEMIAQLQKDRRLVQAFVRARWPALERLHDAGGIPLQLELTQVQLGDRSYEELSTYALGVLQVATLMPFTHRAVVAVQLSNERSGMAALLDAATDSSSANPEVIASSLLVLCNLLCPPPSLCSRAPGTSGAPGQAGPSSGPAVEAHERPARGGEAGRSEAPAGTGGGAHERHPAGGGAPERGGTTERAAALDRAGSSGRDKGPAAEPQGGREGGVPGERRISLGAGGGGPAVAAYMEQGYRMARDAIRASNGIKVLLQLLSPRTLLAPSYTDCIRALACRVLLGLARDPAIAHILTKLQVGRLLSELLRESHNASTPSTSVSGPGGEKWPVEFQKVALELITITTNAGRPSTAAASEAAAPTLRRIERAAIAAATPISFNPRELLQLIHAHLLSVGLPGSASALVQEASLSPLPSAAGAPPAQLGFPLPSSASLSPFPGTGGGHSGGLGFAGPGGAVSGLAGAGAGAGGWGPAGVGTPASGLGGTLASGGGASGAGAGAWGWAGAGAWAGKGMASPAKTPNGPESGQLASIEWPGGRTPRGFLTTAEGSSSSGAPRLGTPMAASSGMGTGRRKNGACQLQIKKLPSLSSSTPGAGGVNERGEKGGGEAGGPGGGTGGALKRKGGASADASHTPPAKKHCSSVGTTSSQAAAASEDTALPAQQGALPGGRARAGEPARGIQGGAASAGGGQSFGISEEGGPRVGLSSSQLVTPMKIGSQGGGEIHPYYNPYLATPGVGGLGSGGGVLSTPMTEARGSGGLAPQADPPSLDAIVTAWLKQQHRQCPAPITTLPPLSLLHPHVCPEPKRFLDAPLNAPRRLAARQQNPPTGGRNGRKHDRHFVYSRFRTWRTCRDEASMLTTAAFFSHASRLVVGTTGGEVRHFDTLTGTQVDGVTYHQSPIVFLQTANQDCEGGPSPPLLLSSTRNEVSLWYPLDTLHPALLTFPNCRAAKFSHNVATIACVGTERPGKEVLLYDVTTGALQHRLEEAAGGAAKNQWQTGVHFSPLDDMLLWNGTLWDPRIPRAIHRFDQFTDYGGGGFHPAGNEVILNSEVWDLRTRRLLRSVPSLDQTSISFNATGDVIYASLRRSSDEIMSALHGRRRRHPLYMAFRTLDAVEYADIATVPIDRCVLDLALEPSDSYLAVVAMDENDEMESIARLYEVGRRRPLDDDSDPDGVEDTDVEEESEAEEEDEEEDEMEAGPPIEVDIGEDGGLGEEDDDRAEDELDRAELGGDESDEIDDRLLEFLSDGQDDDEDDEDYSTDDASDSDYDEYNEIFRDMV